MSKPKQAPSLKHHKKTGHAYARSLVARTEAYRPGTTGDKVGITRRLRMYSMILSYTQNGVDPEAYLEDALMRVATTPESENATLTPWAWTASR